MIEESDSLPALTGLEASFIALLQQVSLATPLPMLSARSRWRHLIEVLLGHAPVRGGRTRDFPFSEQREISARVGEALMGCQTRFRPGQAKKVGTYRAYDLVVALLLLETSVAQSEANLGDESHFSTAIVVLLEELFSGQAALRLASLLGVAAEGVEVSARTIRQYRREILRPAKVLATLAATDPAGLNGQPLGNYLTEYYGLRPRETSFLDERQVSLVYLKARQVQRFLDACRRTFIQRGASYWCSQVTARVRDFLLTLESRNLSLLIDCDSVTVMVASPEMSSAGELADLVDHFLLDPVDSKQVNRDFIARYWPRLDPYFQQAISEEVHTASVLPMLGFDVRVGRSLWSLLTERFFTKQSTQDAGTTIHDWSPPCSASEDKNDRVSAQDPSGQSCYGYSGQRRFSSDAHAMPIWYNPSGRQAYGWASTVFSLAGLAFNRLTIEAIEERMRDKGVADIVCARTQKELLQQTRVKEQPEISFLKLDGDAIGAEFARISLICRPALSIALETAMRETLLNALALIIHEEDLTTAPADLIYFGGDDLLLTLPHAYTPKFLAAFETCWIAHGESRALPEMTFTFAEIIDRPQYLKGAVSEEDDLSLQSVNELLFLAKQQRKASDISRLHGQSGVLQGLSRRLIT